MDRPGLDLAAFGLALTSLPYVYALLTALAGITLLLAGAGIGRVRKG
ncbi:hypothetical protein LYSHEL_15110 [Lysobacter helvus]|uniref:Uncharacterized protein n=2 Tax=Lysobacteraceae TaxID=32033 RepID=A0ABN6FS43_9GAMM|nr:MULTISPECIES: hypothetical protein [Lysobacter]BCT92487.1 hypothetical protein LYSCAS_15110 [Lysobacter caseinilyticus]BCT95640.1 hypothetical protein LYSHEL_15110 [Lysobacter helvus]